MAVGAREIIDTGKMTPLQIAAVAITIGLNALDGFDVLSISFASPGIAREWSIDRAQLGIVLSMELIGMGVGSIALGRVADSIGRRPTILGCLAVMAVGMFLAATARNVQELSAWRLLTGLGIGGMLAAINAVAAEFSNAKWKGVCLAVMVIGYPIGAVIGGAVAASLLQSHDWRAVFQFGAAATALFIPLVFFFVPETPAYLGARQPKGALARINKILSRLGHPQLEALPPLSAAAAKPSMLDILKPGLIRTTLLVTVAYFAHILAFYFILKWIPKIVVDMGFHASAAAGVLVWANVGGVIGGTVFGLLSRAFSLKARTTTVLALSAVLLVVFGRGQADLAGLAWIAGITGLFTNSAVVGLYSILAQAFPTEYRATGTGFVIGVGRSGAALAPMLAGFLFQAGYGLQIVAAFMAAGPLIAAVAVALLRLGARPGAVAAKA